jgi:hypothetical protein
MRFFRRRRGVLAGLLVLATFVACTGGGTTDRGTGPEKPDFEAPPKVKPKSVKSILGPRILKRCTRQERIDIASLTGRYFGPIDFASDQVETVRGLDFTPPGDVAFVEEDEFNELVDEGSSEFDREQKAAERWLNWSFPFWSMGEDNLGGSHDSATELVAGYYDPAQGNIVVHQQGELDGEYVVLAHELAHAAVDQSFDLNNKRAFHIIDDERLAYSALVEGDATLTEMQFSARFSRNDTAIRKTINGIIRNDNIKQQERYEFMPHGLIERSVFPYRWGLAFVCSVYNKRGWKGVNQIYARPPTSSAEVMFPERYLERHKPGKSAGFPKLKNPWKLYEKGPIGALHLKSLFEAPADQPQVALSRPLARAASWDGGRYQLWGRRPSSRASALGVTFVEHKDHPGLLCSSLMEWHELAFDADTKVIGDGVVAYEGYKRVTVLSCDGRDVRMAMAPSEHLAAEIANL